MYRKRVHAIIQYIDVLLFRFSLVFFHENLSAIAEFTRYGIYQNTL